MAKKNGVFVNGISEKLIRTQINKTTGKEFASVSVPTASYGFLSVAVNPGQVMPATKFNSKEVIDGLKSILLGAADKARTVTYKAADGSIQSIELTNAQIVAEYKAQRKAYRDAKANAAVEG